MNQKDIRPNFSFPDQNQVPHIEKIKHDQLREPSKWDLGAIRSLYQTLDPDLILKLTETQLIKLYGILEETKLDYDSRQRITEAIIQTMLTDRHISFDEAIARLVT